FGAHNATEGFGIVAPLTAAEVRPTWGRLILLGVIGGGPTFIGTLVGQAVTAPLLGVAFVALAAGSILYVGIEMPALARPRPRQQAQGTGQLGDPARDRARFRHRRNRHRGRCLTPPAAGV